MKSAARSSRRPPCVQREVRVVTAGEGRLSSGSVQGPRWGDEIPPERAALLEDLLRRSRAGLAAGQEAFIGMRLTGGDVFWLAAEALAAAPPGRLTHARAA